MTDLLLSFLAGAVVGVVVFGTLLYCKGKRDGLQALSDENMEDIKRKDQRDKENRDRRMKKHLRNLG